MGDLKSRGAKTSPVITDNMYLQSQEGGVAAPDGYISLDQLQNIVTPYDGVDTEANILAMSATTFLGQSWFATDTKIVYKAITNILTVDAWQSLTVKYGNTTDTYALGPTQDGQMQDIGREIFYIACNTGVSGATALNPKVFLSIGTTVGNEQFQNVLLAAANDLSEGSFFGLNTTDLGSGVKGKLTTYGELKDINTSAWLVNDILYVDTVAGDLTNVQPSINGFAVARVLKMDATTGIIFVNTIATNRTDPAEIPIGIDRIYLTADEETPVATTFFEALREDRGTIAEATEVIVVPDDSTVGAAQDHISMVLVSDTTSRAGLKRAFLDFSQSIGNAQEKIHLEIYHADANGVPIDSGILTESITDFAGVRPVVLMSSSLLDTPSGTIFHQELTGLQSEDFAFPSGDRLLMHVRCEKIGVAGADKVFTIYFGTDHSSYIEAVQQIGSSLQSAYEIDPDIVTTAVIGPVTMTRGSAADTDNVFGIKNGAGTETVAITGNGKIHSELTELVLEQTGDLNGDMKLSLQNRDDYAGILLESSTIDFLGTKYVPNTGYASSWVYEHRASFIMGSDNTVGEFQFLDDVDGFVDVVFSTGIGGTIVNYSDLTVVDGDIFLLKGDLIQKPSTSITPVVNGELVFEATSNTSLTIKHKGTDGTVRSVVLTLT